MELRPSGDRGILAVLDRSITASALHAAAASVRTIRRVVACIPGHSSLLTIWSGAPDVQALREAIERAGRHDPLDDVQHHLVTVSFGEAPDLDELLWRTGMSLDGFLGRVATLRLTARYLGFRAGFAYLDGWPPEWAMPRRPTSRPRVEAGTFAIAGATAGFYPIDSPGGWNLLGRTDATLWDEHREPPNLIAPGDTIAIVPTLEPPAWHRPTVVISRLELPFAEVLSAPLTRVVGAADWRHVDSGRPVGGPFDLRSATFANAATANPADAPLLECAMSGPRLRMTHRGVLSWFGARATVRIRGRTVEDPRLFEVATGDEVTIGPLSGGLRGYLAFGMRRGTLASARSGDRLRIRVVEGPDDGFAGEVACEVTADLDRVGIRMRPLDVSLPQVPADLVSCGMQFGTVQLHPDGTLVAMGPDHPVTGGYLQPMTVISDDLWKLGQLAPKERVVFAPV